MRSRRRAAVLGLLLCAAAIPAAAQEENQWGYDKGFFFRTPKFEVKISTRTQIRYTYTMFDQDSTFDDNGYFNLPRTRLRLDGFAYYPWLKYKVQYDFTGAKDEAASGTNAGLRRPDLRDLYFDLARNPRATVRLGQFKAPFGIQELTSSGEQEFVDRSIVNDGYKNPSGTQVLEEFVPSRQQGASLWGTTFEKKFGYDVGIFNGNSRNKNQNDNSGYMYVARVHWDPNGEYKLSESAVDYPEKVNYTLGAAYMMNDTQQSLLKTAERLSQKTAEAFFALKYKRLFVLADAYGRTEEQAAGAPDIDSEGYIAQVGYFFVPRKIEVALRRAQGDPDTDRAAKNDKVTEQRIGFGYYINKHDLKFQADYGQIKDDASVTDNKTDVFRAQFQIVF